MIRMTQLLESYSKLDTILDSYREQTNWTDWYMSGGCYTFADALYNYLGNKGKFIAVGEVGTGVMTHVVLQYNGKYCDYNGCRTKNDVLGDISLYDKPEWFEVKRNDVMRQHNYDRSEVSKIVSELKKIK